MKALEVISYWEELKKLIEKSDKIYADPEIEKINRYLYQQIEKEINGE